VEGGITLNLVERKEFIIRPLPKKVVEYVGEKITESYKHFNPHKRITVDHLYTVFRQLSALLKSKKFGDMYYEFQFIPNFDIETITFEMYVKKVGLKPKLCVMSERLNLKEMTAASFMNKFQNIVIDSNQSIAAWNNIMSTHDIMFYSRPPIEVLNDLFIHKLYELNYIVHDKMLDGFYALEALNFADEMRFGKKKEWSFHSTFTGNEDWGIIQYWITHKGLKGISFVMDEIEGDFYNYYTKRNLIDLEEYVMQRITLGMMQWNALIKEHELKGVVRDDNAIDLERYATATKPASA